MRPRKPRKLLSATQTRLPAGPIPQTPISMFPQMCNAGGLKYADLIEELLQLGTNRFEKKRELLTSR